MTWRQRAAVGLVHDDALGALEHEVFSATRGLDEVGRDDGAAVPIKHRDPERQIAFQTLDRAAQHQFSLEVEFFS
jgi:hypothetical protein